MNIYIVENDNIALLYNQLAKSMLTMAAQSLHFNIIDNESDADVILFLEEQVTCINDNAKLFTITDLNELFQSPSETLSYAVYHACKYVDIKQPLVIKSTSQTDRQLPVLTKRVIAVTACPTGVAHTYMAAEAIAEEAKKRGWCKVETQGSVGINNALTKEDIDAADLVIIASDIEFDLTKFIGKVIYQTKTSTVLKQTAQEFEIAISNAKLYYPEKMEKTDNNDVMNGERKSLYSHLLTGFSYMLPVVVIAGLATTLEATFASSFSQQSTLVQALNTISDGGWLLAVSVLAGYISLSISGRVGLGSGLIGGILAAITGAGPLGGIVAGYLAGYITKIITKWLRLPQSIEALKPILIIPLFSGVLTGVMMAFLFCEPIALIMTMLNDAMINMPVSAAIILGAILGGIMCADMGGPINKMAYIFGVGLLCHAQYAPMAAVMAGGMVPPLAMAFSTLFTREKFTSVEQQLGKKALVLGLCFISEGVLPFVKADPYRVNTCCMLGGAIAGGMALSFGSQLILPHGGVFTFLIPGAITPILGYFLSILVGALIAGGLYSSFKPFTH